jgi:hypothetical protein
MQARVSHQSSRMLDLFLSNVYMMIKDYLSVQGARRGVLPRGRSNLSTLPYPQARQVEGRDGKKEKQDDNNQVDGIVTLDASRLRDEPTEMQKVQVTLRFYHKR